LPPGAATGTPADGFTRKWFETRPWYEPLIADPRAAHVSLIPLALSREFPFMTEGGKRGLLDINFGKELPFVLREKGTSGDTPIAPGAWGFGVWLPVSVHFVEDLKGTENPIVNTDYRMAAAFKVAHGLSRSTRDRLFFKLQIGHESSHVGDEFLLNALERFGQEFERVDVSFEYVEAGVSWDHTLGPGVAGQFTLRVSASSTLKYKGSRGYYDPVLKDGRQLTPSVRHFEPAVGVQFVPLGTGGAGLIVSLDARQKTIYDFHREPPDQSEHAQWSYSLIVGIRPLNLRARGTPEFVVKAYHGVNPNGLFRMQRDYWLIGTGIHVRV
jgi:hypothetical protein